MIRAGGSIQDSIDRTLCSGVAQSGRTPPVHEFIAIDGAIMIQIDHCSLRHSRTVLAHGATLFDDLLKFHVIVLSSAIVHYGTTKTSLLA